MTCWERRIWITNIAPCEASLKHSHTQPANIFVCIGFRVAETVSECECVCESVFVQWCMLSGCVDCFECCFWIVRCCQLSRYSVEDMVLWYWSWVRWLIPQGMMWQVWPSGLLSTCSESHKRSKWKQRQCRGMMGRKTENVIQRKRAKFLRDKILSIVPYKVL